MIILTVIQLGSLQEQPTRVKAVFNDPKCFTFVDFRFRLEYCVKPAMRVATINYTHILTTHHSFMFPR